MLREEVPRWATASINTFIATNLVGLAFVPHGMAPDASTPNTYVELRIHGPYPELYQRNYSVIRVSLDFIIHTPSSADRHLIPKYIGMIAKIMTKPIVIKKYGDTPVDDNTTILGYFVLDRKPDTIYGGDTFVRPETGKGDVGTLELMFEAELEGVAHED